MWGDAVTSDNPPPKPFTESASPKNTIAPDRESPVVRFYQHLEAKLSEEDSLDASTIDPDWGRTNAGAGAQSIAQHLSSTEGSMCVSTVCNVEPAVENRRQVDASVSLPGNCVDIDTSIKCIKNQKENSEHVCGIRIGCSKPHEKVNEMGEDGKDCTLNSQPLAPEFAVTSDSPEQLELQKEATNRNETDEFGVEHNETCLGNNDEQPANKEAITKTDYWLLDPSVKVRNIIRGGTKDILFQRHEVEDTETYPKQVGKICEIPETVVSCDDVRESFDTEDSKKNSKQQNSLIAVKVGGFFNLQK
ncbi:hypothetical protein HDU82_009154 [Entophlyctis luteolus]|nr:hypothetical protein HDU82_009154 [Entophlyctis luteolus]